MPAGAIGCDGCVASTGCALEEKSSTVVGSAVAEVSEEASTDAASPLLAADGVPWSHAATNGTLARTSAAFQFKKELAFINLNRFLPPIRPPLMSLPWCFQLL
jgi:hypothetical protein